LTFRQHKEIGKYINWCFIQNSSNTCEIIENLKKASEKYFDWKKKGNLIEKSAVKKNSIKKSAVKRRLRRFVK
jgi:hypothetical protein